MLSEALENWAEWGLLEEPSLIKVFKHGQNHHTGLIESGDTRLVLKVFKHSFSRTIAAEAWASERSIAPTLHMAANNIALYQFVEDRGFSPSSLSAIAKTLTLTHQEREPTGKDFELLSVCQQYLTTADSSAHLWHKALIPALLAFRGDPTPWTFCHNDLVVENCLFNDGSVQFIDWEFAQRNNPWFDLAAIIVYFKLDQSEAQEFLSAYKRGWSNKTTEAIFYTSQIALLWCDLLWNMHNHGKQYRLENPERFQQLAALAAKIDIILPTA